MSTDPADLQSPQRPDDGDAAKRHGDELAEVVEVGSDGSGPDGEEGEHAQ
jgi:hypothetical protein